MYNRRKFIKVLSGGLAALPFLKATSIAQNANKPNLLFIITDQQRWDALSYAGNTILQTPNLDRLASESAYFELAHTECPVCAPARTSILTGRSIQNTGVQINRDAKDNVPVPYKTFDELLAEQGYTTRYYGKWHSPVRLAEKYDNAVSPSGMGNWERGPGMKPLYMAYLKDRFPQSPLKPGEQYCTFDERPYVPDPIDTRYGMAPVESFKVIRRELKVSQPDHHGKSTIPAEYSITAMQAKDTINALEQIQDKPFSLTCSFHFPHPPMAVSEPYASIYPPEDMPVPESINDPMDNSPYRDANDRLELEEYRDKEKIRYMISNYYRLVKEIDDWIGKILAKLDDLGLSDNTMVIFTSDHGEMMGAHGMRSKNVFYNEAVHIPLIIRFPVRIKKGTRVSEPVSQIDLYATILDYLGIDGIHSDGASLRRFIEKTHNDKDPFAVSEWRFHKDDVPTLMVCTKKWKFFCPHTPDSRVMNVLYDLENDPYEMHNLLGSNPDAKTYEEQAEYMKSLLVSWLEKVNSPHLDSVKKRPGL